MLGNQQETKNMTLLVGPNLPIEWYSISGQERAAKAEEGFHYNLHKH